MSWLEYDDALLAQVEARLDLRQPNASALRATAGAIRNGDGIEVVCDLATGVGKTYLAAGLVEYLSASGVRNILFVTPGTTIERKTVDNFTPGRPKFVPGADHEVSIVTAHNFARGHLADDIHSSSVTKLFILTVQQLIRPTANTSRRIREMDEFIGDHLYNHLRNLDDLVIIADEHHTYRAQARAFRSAIEDLTPRALVGLTATPDAADRPKIVYQYSLAEAIADGYVKIPVIVYREDGIKDIDTQLADACVLRERKEVVWQRWAEQHGQQPLHPVLFVVCQSIADADIVVEKLARHGYLPQPNSVLSITSQSSDKALSELERVESPDSPVRAVVSVDKLKEGWDVKNIGVIVGLRALASQTLTEQILGRGLRLPFGKRLGVPSLDQVDIVAHDSYRQLLQQKDSLLQRVVPSRRDPSLTGSAVPTGSTVSTTPLLGFDSRTDDAAPDRSARESELADEVHDENKLRLVTRPAIISDDDEGGAEVLQLMPFESAKTAHETDARLSQRVLYKVDGAPTIRFPRREREVLPVSFSLSLIRNSDVQSEGAGFSGEFPVHLTRRSLNAQRDLQGGVSVHERREADEEATQRYRPIPEVRKELEHRIWDLGLVEQSLSELNAASRITREFLLGAGVVGDEEETLWSERRTRQATLAIADLVKRSYEARKLQPHYRFRVVEIPLRTSMPTDVTDKWNDFVKRRWYRGWGRSIQAVASFDAKSTEWKLAWMFDSSPSVQWWLRLYEPGEAWIERDSGKKYYPDFVVLDTSGVYWVVEGKSDAAARDADVLDKKAAAEEWARYVRDAEEFGVWRYVFATETHLKFASTWEELLVRVRPER